MTDPGTGRGSVELPLRTGHLPCVADAPDGFHTQMLTITRAPVSTHPAPRHPAAPAGSSIAGSSPGLGATLVRGQSTRWSSRAI